MSGSTFAPLPDRIVQLLHDIEVIKAELSEPAKHPTTGLAVPKVSIGIVNQLKYSIDQLRLFLWAYQDSWARGASSPDQRLQQIRTEAAADILKMLSNEFSNKGVPATPEVTRLREQLRTVGALLSAAT